MVQPQIPDFFRQLDNLARQITGDQFRLKRDDPEAPMKFTAFLEQSAGEFEQTTGQPATFNDFAENDFDLEAAQGAAEARIADPLQQQPTFVGGEPPPSLFDQTLGRAAGAAGRGAATGGRFLLEGLEQQVLGAGGLVVGEGRAALPFVQETEFDRVFQEARATGLSMTDAFDAARSFSQQRPQNAGEFFNPFLNPAAGTSPGAPGGSPIDFTIGTADLAAEVLNPANFLPLVGDPGLITAPLRAGRRAATAAARDLPQRATTAAGRVLPERRVFAAVDEVSGGNLAERFNKAVERLHEPNIPDFFTEAKAGREVVPELLNAVTGEPFEATLFRGFGRQTAEQVFDPNVGAQINILGDGIYTTPNLRFAENFGPQIEELRVSLKNPLVIANDTQYNALAREAGLVSNAPANAAEAASFRRVIEARGHDGVIVLVPETELTGKRLIQVFGDDTVVDFGRVRPDVEARTPAGRQAGEAAELPSSKQVQIRAKQPVASANPIQGKLIDDTITQAETTDITRLDAQLARGGSPPTRKSGQAPATGGAPPPRGPDNVLELDLDIPGHEKPQGALMRRFEGARNVESLEIEDFAHTGDGIIKRSGVNPKRLNAENMRPLFEVLHGERSIDDIPVNLRPVVEHALTLRDLEQADMLRFLDNAKEEGFEQFLAWDVKTLAERMMAIPDYFPRLWKQPAEQTVRKVGTARAFGATPTAARARVDASFSELLDAGFEPASWNPVTMMAIRRMEGVMYREQVKLANNLKRLGKMLPEQEAPDGFRVPDIKSPVFNGKPIPRIVDQTPEKLAAIDAWIQRGGDGPFPGEIVNSPKLSVPNEVADQLELFYGKRMQAWLRLPFGREIDVFKLTDDFTNASKRLAVFGSWFQHVDIARRGIAARFASNAGLPRPLALKDAATSPGLVWKLMKLQWIPSERVALRKRFLRDVKVVDAPNSPTWRELVEEGLNIQGDTSFIQRDAIQALDETARASNVPIVGKALENYRTMRDFLESGLFDGVYRGGMEDSAQKFTVPELIKQHPDWTSRQIAADAARTTNEIYSALGNWQTVLSNPNLRRFMQWLIFSTNESETLIKQAIRAMNPRDPNGRIWRKFALGIFMSLAIEANVKNLIATGQPLPLEAYIPVQTDDPYAHLFGFSTGIGYNNRFLSPQVPGITGRNGLPVFEDLMGQMDTSLRWATDPTGSLASRLNRLPSAIRRQDKQESFRGEPLDTPVRKAIQLAIDLGLPFFGAGALEILADKFPSVREAIPLGESRLGSGAQAFQTGTGINLRTLNIPELDAIMESGEFNGQPLTDEMRANIVKELAVRKEERKRKGFFISGKPEDEKKPLNPASERQFIEAP